MKLLFKGPVLTASGYGVHSRQLLQALIECGVFDISVMAINWGQTPFLFQDDSFMRHVMELVKKRDTEVAMGNARYDVSIQVTIPNEFEKLAPINIGVTAGIEVDRVTPEWIVKSNENVDLLVVPSRHAAETFAGTQYQGQNGEVIRLQKQIFVAPEGVDTEVFHPGLPDGWPELKTFQFNTKFNFLAVGLGFERGVGEDRKNLSTLVKWFCERFKDDKDVGLVLKSSLVGYSLMDFEAIQGRIKDLKKLAGVGEYPAIHLVHGRLSDTELANLYRNPQVKAFITLTHGEGFGLPVLEAAACGLPVLATNWSGHIDFLSIGDRRRFIPLEYDLSEIPASAHWKGVMEPGSRWANVKEDDVKNKMRKVVLSYEKPKEWATELATHIQNVYDVKKTNYEFAQAIVKFIHQPRQKPGATTEEEFVKLVRDQLQLSGKKTLLYTMPMSAGDVFISTAIIDSLKKKYPDHLIYFGTGEQYQSILKDNPNVHQVIQWDQWMANVPLCERIFDQVYTPNLAIQTLSANWVKGGKGRRLGDEMAAQCQVEFGDYFIKEESISGLPDDGNYIVLQPGSGKGQWEARNYLHWQEVVNNLIKLTGYPVLQVGAPDDPLYKGVWDFRGKTTYNQLAYVIKRAAFLVSIDTVSMHMAAALGTPHVAIFGSSYSTSTGPVYKRDENCRIKNEGVLLDTPSRYTCEKACYKYQCSVDKDHPCVNEIDPRMIVSPVVHKILNDTKKAVHALKLYEEYHPTISGYTHLFNAIEQKFPFVESINSMMGFCDEVVVVDGGSTDGTLEALKKYEEDLKELSNIFGGKPRKLRVVSNPWDWNEPGMDGMQKAFGRAMCEGEFLWQQDADEIIHEDDYEKIRNLTKRFPKDVDLLSLPVVEFWGNDKRVRTDRHSWKWRMSRNNFRITHGINKDARVNDEQTGKVYAKKGMSDGCEYIDIMTGEYISHKNFYTPELERLRQSDPVAYGKEMNRIFQELPSVFHYSWADIPRKILNFKKFWNKCWSNLYNDSTPVDRFPDVNADDPESVQKKAKELLERGGEHEKAATFELIRESPIPMRYNKLPDAAMLSLMGASVK